MFSKLQTTLSLREKQLADMSTVIGEMNEQLSQLQYSNLELKGQRDQLIEHYAVKVLILPFLHFRKNLLKRNSRKRNFSFRKCKACKMKMIGLRQQYQLYIFTRYFRLKVLRQFQRIKSKSHQHLLKILRKRKFLLKMKKLIKRRLMPRIFFSQSDPQLLMKIKNNSSGISLECFNFIRRI